jgi:hypothetical protein
MPEKIKWPYPLLPSVKRQLLAAPADVRQRILDSRKNDWSDPDFRRLALQQPMAIHANELTINLLIGAQNILLNQNVQPSLDPHRVAQVLAWLAETEPSDMNWVVGQSLRWLGIKRGRRGPGRAKGREKDTVYAVYFAKAMQMIEEEQLWATKQEFRRKYPSGWQPKLERYFQKKEWGPETVDMLAKSPSKRAFAIHMLSRHFDVAYDTVARAITRSEKRTPIS